MGWSSWETQRSGCVKALLSLRARGRLLPARELARRCGGEAGVRTTLSLKVKVKMPAQHTVQERRWDRPQASAQGGGGRDQAEEGLSLLLPSAPGAALKHSGDHRGAGWSPTRRKMQGEVGRSALPGQHPFRGSLTLRQGLRREKHPPGGGSASFQDVVLAAPSLPTPPPMQQPTLAGVPAITPSLPPPLTSGEPPLRAPFLEPLPGLLPTKAAALLKNLFMSLAGPSAAPPLASRLLAAAVSALRPVSAPGRSIRCVLIKWFSQKSFDLEHLLLSWVSVPGWSQAGLLKTSFLSTLKINPLCSLKSQPRGGHGHPYAHSSGALACPPRASAFWLVSQTDPRRVLALQNKLLAKHMKTPTRGNPDGAPTARLPKPEARG